MNAKPIVIIQINLGCFTQLIYLFPWITSRFSFWTKNPAVPLEKKLVCWKINMHLFFCFLFWSRQCSIWLLIQQLIDWGIWLNFLSSHLPQSFIHRVSAHEEVSTLCIMTAVTCLEKFPNQKRCYRFYSSLISDVKWKQNPHRQSEWQTSRHLRLSRC